MKARDKLAEDLARLNRWQSARPTAATRPGKKDAPKPKGKR